MTSMLQRCAVCFAHDLPEGRRVLSPALAALVESWSESLDTTRAQADKALAVATSAEIEALELEFAQRFAEDWAACSNEIDRIGQRDHLPFEEVLRADAIEAALLAGSVDDVARLWTPDSGRHSPFARADLDGALARRWEILELLCEALLSKDAAKIPEARLRRRSVPPAWRRRLASLGGVIGEVSRHVTGRYRRPRRAATPETPTSTLQVHTVAALHGSQALVAVNADELGGTHLMVRAVDATRGLVLMFDRATSSLTLTTPVVGPEPTALVQAFTQDASPLEVAVIVARDGVEIATATTTIESTYLYCVQAAAGGVTVAMAAAPPAYISRARENAAAPAAAPRGARLTDEPTVQRALDRFFNQKEIHDSDLHSIGGPLLKMRWALEIERFAALAGFTYRLDEGPSGRLYRLI